MLCKDRQGKITIEENSQDNMLKKLYGSISGRILLKIITKPIFSRLIGNILNLKVSTKIIDPFISSNNIDMSDYPERTYISYNDFFTRKIKDDARHFDMAGNALISPADGRISAYKIDENSVFKIKDSYYTVESITRSQKAANHYKNGYFVIIRLCVDNYHRYCYIDNGTLGTSKFINGILHTVNPEALNHYDIYKENCRECTVINTDNFGKVMQIEVGALMVGKIVNYHHDKGHKIIKGTEKGKFEFGGSTIVLIFEKDKVMIDADILKNTNDGFETAIHIGEKIGVSVN